MKFIRPLLEIEAMPLRNEDGVVYGYACDYGDGKDTPIFTVEQLEQQGFRLLNGHIPGKPLKRRKKTNYRSSGEAPDLSGEEPKETVTMESVSADGLSRVSIHESAPLDLPGTYIRKPLDPEQEQRIRDEVLGHIEPAQEYDHQ